jgi:heat shock protein HtpX
MHILNRDELSTVLAHERWLTLATAATLIMTVAAAMAGAITFLAMMARLSMIFGGLGGGRRSGDNGQLLGL